MAAGVYCTYLRFFRGLGASTNLSDQFPWGLWIGFDVMCGVMLAAGGFTLTAAVEIFNIKRFHSIVRPTILTAFLGYLLVCAALMYDLGLPWNIWHPLIMRNPHSVMFEVAYCVMFYTTVLALEFSPIVLEHFKLQESRCKSCAASWWCSSFSACCSPPCTSRRSARCISSCPTSCTRSGTVRCCRSSSSCRRLRLDWP